MSAAAVSPMLVRLADERATGVLIRDHGALYLVDGQVVHAEAPAAPGLDVLLTASGRLRPDRWEDAVAQAGARNGVARYLVDSGQVADGEMEICHLAALYDAAYFALGPAGGPTRFRYGVHHWLGRVRPVPTRAVEREALRRGRLLNSVWPHASVDTAPVAVRAQLRGRVVSPLRRSLLELADGVRTPAAIARKLGRPAFNTLIEVRRLAAEGLIGTPAPTPVLVPVPATAYRSGAGTGTAYGSGAGTGTGTAYGSGAGTGTGTAYGSGGTASPRHARPSGRGPESIGFRGPRPDGRTGTGANTDTATGTGAGRRGRLPDDGTGTREQAPDDPEAHRQAALGTETYRQEATGAETYRQAPGGTGPGTHDRQAAAGAEAHGRAPDGTEAHRRTAGGPGFDGLVFPGPGPLGLGPMSPPDTALLRRIRDALEAPL